MILTVSIPTYNRPEKLKNTLIRLIPQLTDKVSVTVFDNGSDVVLSDYLQKELEASVFDRIRVVRNRVNIGADANFLRCFELCETPYNWLLGDDDRIEPNAVSTILNEIDHYKDQDLIGINFRSNCLDIARPSPVFITSTKDLSEKLDHFGNWLFISTTVYDTKAYCKYLNFSMFSAYAMCSQIIPAMHAISHQKVFILSEKYIVTNVPEASNKKWSNYQLNLGLPSVLETSIGFKKKEYKSFGSKLEPMLSYVLPGDTLFSIIKSVNYNVDLIDDYHVFIFKHLIMSGFEFRKRKLFLLSQYYLSLFFLKNKWALKLAMQYTSRLKKGVDLAPSFSLFKRS